MSEDLAVLSPLGTGRPTLVPVGPPRWFSTLHIVLRHVGAVAAIILFPLNESLVMLLLVSYSIRMWGMEAVYHRYFSHRSFQTSRWFQFTLALIGIQCGQRGPLWWAYVHRVHHRAADTVQDRHSPIAYSFGQAYFGWMRRPDFAQVDWNVVPDFAKYPELRWLTRFYEVPLELVGLLIAAGGHWGWLGPQVTAWSALLWGYCVPTMLVMHATAMVNTFGHLPRFRGGYRRYRVDTYTVNRPVLSFFMLGAAFHNNHHRLASSARAGFAWFELDPTYWSLRLFRATGLIFDLRDDVPEAVLHEGRIGTKNLLR